MTTITISHQKVAKFVAQIEGWRKTYKDTSANVEIEWGVMVGDKCKMWILTRDYDDMKKVTRLSFGKKIDREEVMAPELREVWKDSASIVWSKDHKDILRGDTLFKESTEDESYNRKTGETSKSDHPILKILQDSLSSKKAVRFSTNKGLGWSVKYSEAIKNE